MLAQAYTKSRLHKLSSSPLQAYRQSYQIILGEIGLRAGELPSRGRYVVRFIGSTAVESEEGWLT